MAARVSELMSSWRREPADWRVDARLAAASLAVPLLGSALLAVLALWRRMFLALVKEDGPLEWSQFAIWIVAGVLSLSVTWRLQRHRRWMLAVLWAVLGLGCLAAAGEEISWGQRVLGLETPARLEELNEQDEITIHNLSFAYTLFRVTMLVAGVYGSLFAVAVRVWARRRYSALTDMLIPPCFLATWFLVLAVYRGARMAFFPDPGPMISGYGEWPESCLAFGIMAFAFLVWRRERTVQPPPGPQGLRPSATPAGPS